jgi:uncharacterized membrane protein
MKAAAKTIIVLSILGVINAAYLTYLFIKQSLSKVPINTFCDINNTFSCTSVITSPYAQIFGISICTIALLVYPVLIILAWVALQKKNPQNLFFAIAIIAAMGTMMNLLSIYNEYAFIGSYCALCILCSLFIITILIMSIIGYAKSPTMVVVQTSEKTPLIKSVIAKKNNQKKR